MYRKSPLLNLDNMALNVTTTENQMPRDDMRRHPCTGHGYSRMYRATTTNWNPTFPAQKEGHDEGAADTLWNNDEGNYLSGATYLITNKEYLRELTDDIEQLFAKAKTILPKEDGVPLEEDSEKKKVKTNDEIASTEANNY